MRFTQQKEKEKKKKRNDGALGVLWKRVVDNSKEEEEIGIPFSYYYYYISTALHGQSGAHRPTAPHPRPRAPWHASTVDPRVVFVSQPQPLRPSVRRRSRCCYTLQRRMHPMLAGRNTGRLGSTGAFTCWTGLLRPTVQDEKLSSGRARA